jgi:type IX secretion system substrate protein
MKQILFAMLCIPTLAGAQTITTYAGGGPGGLGDGGPATAALVSKPVALTFDKSGNLFISDEFANRVRKVDASGLITTFAGPGVTGVIGDGGPATAAYLQYAQGITCDTVGNLFIADSRNYRVRKVNAATGIISTVAGTGTTVFGGSGDGGQATAAQFNTPSDVKFDKKGNLYIADNSASVVRKVNAAGVVSTVAGIGGSLGDSGDEGPATAALLHDPTFLAFDETGNLYIAEQIGHRIRKVDTFGIIHTIAGTGASGYNGDSIAATSAKLNPLGMVFFNNALYVSTSDHRVRKIDFDNDSNYVYTVAGNGTYGYTGDGIPPLTAELYNPSGLALRGCGDLYIADLDNSRVRRIALLAGPLIPAISLSGIASYNVGNLVTVTAMVSNAGSSYLIHWLNHGVQFATTTGPTVTYTKTVGTDSISARVVSTATWGAGCYDSTTSSGFLIHAILGIETVNTGGESTVYPNPTSGVLNVSGPNITSVIISNLLGQVVYTHVYAAKQVQIDVADFPKGIYLVRVNGTEVRKFVKE